MSVLLVKQRLCVSEPPVGKLRGQQFIFNLLESLQSTSSMLLNIFRQLLRLRRYKQILVEVGVFQKGCHFKRKFQLVIDMAHQPLLASENSINYPFMQCQNFSCMFFTFVTKHACVGRTDGQTDGQKYDPQDRASIAASRGNINNIILLYNKSHSITKDPHNKTQSTSFDVHKPTKHNITNRTYVIKDCNFLIRLMYDC